MRKLLLALIPAISFAGPHDYFDDLRALPEHWVSYDLRSDVGLEPLHGAFRPENRSDPAYYDINEDAARWDFAGNDASNGTADQLFMRFPDDVRNGTIFIAYEAKWADNWPQDLDSCVTDADRCLETHKAFRLDTANCGTYLIEQRVRYTQRSGGNVGRVDSRVYGNYVSPGRELDWPEYVVNDVQIPPGKWTRWFIWVDFNTNTYKLWVGTEDIEPRLVTDYQWSSMSRDMGCQRLEMNTSQDKTGPLSTPIWVRNWVALRNVSSPDAYLSTASLGGGGSTVQTDYYVASNGSDNNPGTISQPFATASAVNVLSLGPGNRVYFRKGDSFGQLVLSGDAGSVSSPIVIDSYGTGDDPVLFGIDILSGSNNVTVQNVTVDHDKLAGDAIRVRDSINVILKDFEARNGTQDAIDFSGADNLLIENGLIHHFLNGSFTSQADAHGITGSDSNVVSILNTEIYQVSGDSVQVDPDRDTDIVQSVVIDGCTFWTAPLTENFNSGWLAGQRPGENALDTKVVTSGWDSVDRMNITVRDTVAYGWIADSYINNKAAWNLKEKVQVTLTNVTTYDSEIAYRIRGGRGNANVTISGGMTRNVEKAIRAEDNLVDLSVTGHDFRGGIDDHLELVGSTSTATWTLTGNTFYGTVPGEFTDATNIVSTGQRAYFDWLNTAPEGTLVLSRAYETQAQIDGDLNGTNNIFPPVFDGTEEAARWDLTSALVEIWPDDSLRPSWTQVSSGNLFVSWEFKLSDNFGAERDTLQTTDAFQLGYQGDEGLNFRLRHTLASSPYDTRADLELNANNGWTLGSGTADPLSGSAANFDIEDGKWVRAFAFINFDDDEISYWLADEDRTPIQVFNARSITAVGSIDEFWFDWSAASGVRSGATINFYGRNLAILSGVTNPADLVQAGAEVLGSVAPPSADTTPPNPPTNIELIEGT